jgi:osmotically-inducible protein OsmY
MKDIDTVSFLAGLAAGALAMYYFDAASGGRRRALVRDKIVAAGHDAAWLAQAKAKRAADHLRGVVATRHLDRVTRARPESDAQLYDRIRARLGHLISHPKSVEVEVHEGCVTLKGRILTKELDRMLREVRCMAGVKTVDNQLTCHDRGEGIPELQGRTEPPGRRQRRAQPA